MHEPSSWAQRRRNAQGNEISYDFAISTGVVSINEIRRSPYHNSITHSSSDAKSLVDGEIKELHSRDWDCNLHIFDIQKDGRLPSAESAVCRFLSEYQEYYTRNIEEFRSRVLETSAPRTARLTVIEDLIPPVMELLGYSLDLDPGLFSRHLGYAWGPGLSLQHLPEFSELGTPDLIFVSPYPRMFEVQHPFAWNQADWRNECLKRAAKFLQCRQLSPVLDVPEQHKVLCTAFEHTTISVQLDSESGGNWKATVLFPSSVKFWEEGSLRVSKHQHIDPRSRIHASQRVSQSKDPDVSTWLSALRVRNEDGADLTDPFHIVDALLREGLAHWNTHLVHVARAVDVLSTSNSSAEDIGLQPQQQIRALIFQGAGLISEILDSISAAIDAKSCFKSAKGASGDGSSSKQPQLEDLHRRFTHVKIQLERHLPALQHHIDIIRIRQQNRLAETQLEESRKAIQQADTIKRLTILAFIYIPIQTSAALFGMNIREIAQSSGMPSAWMFTVTTTILLGATLLAAGWKHVWSFVYRQKHQKLGSVRRCGARQLERIGIHVEASSQYGPEGQMGDAKPSWVF